MKKQRIGLMYLLIAACAGGLYMANNGLGNCLGLFYISLSDAIGKGIGSVSLCVTISSVITGFAAKLMPGILEKVHFKVIVTIGMLLLAGGVAASVFAASLPVLIVCFVVKGIGGCLIGMTTINFLVDNWFYQGSGTVLGVAMSTSGVIGAILSPWFSSLAENYGWRFSLTALAGVSILLCLPTLFFARTRPEEKAMKPYGYDTVKTTAVRSNSTGAAPYARDFTYYSIVALMFLITAVFCMASHVATYASSIGLSLTTSALLMSTTMVGNMAFKVIIGVLCDKINPIRTSLITFSFTAISFPLFILGTKLVWVNFVAAVFFGATFGSCTVAVGQIIKMVFAREHFSKVYSTALMTSSIASAVFGLLLGYSYDWFGTYVPALTVFFVLSLIAVVLLVLLNQKQKQRTVQ